MLVLFITLVMKMYQEYENHEHMEDASSVIRIQHLEISLEKAIGEISLLQ